MTCPLCGSSTFDVLGWLADKGIRLRPTPAYVIRHLFENPGKYREWGDVATDLRLSLTTTRWQMRKKSMPAPSRWLTLVRALDMARLIRDNPNKSVERIAYMVGFEDHSGLVHHLKRAFGVSPTELRSRAYETEELVELWWIRQQVRVRG